MLNRREMTGLAGSAFGAALIADAKAADSVRPKLFPGEQLLAFGGFPTLVKFRKGRDDQPLVVFVPGTSFLARIAYGFPDGRPDDFLDHWLVAAGYSFLGVSYPLDNPVYDRVYPTFDIKDWGRQVAGAARHFVDANGLGHRIVVVGWSMGGKPVEAIAEAARTAALEIELFVALDALPPGPNLWPGNAEQFRLAPNGLVDQADSLLPWFKEMVAAQDRLNGHTIIPADRFEADFTGNPPLDIQGENVRFVAGRMVVDVAAAAADSGASDYSAYPPIALIISNSPADFPNVLLCRTNWGLFIGQQLYRRHVFPARERMPSLAPERWAGLQAAFADVVSHLTIQIAGTHFLFLGEKGARATAAAVTQLRERATALDAEIAKQIDDAR